MEQLGAVKVQIFHQDLALWGGEKENFCDDNNGEEEEEEEDIKDENDDY